jgi:hypothetical protein
MLGVSCPIVERAESFVSQSIVLRRRKQHNVGKSFDPAECPLVRRGGNPVPPSSGIHVETICFRIRTNQAQLWLVRMARNDQSNLFLL